MREIEYGTSCAALDWHEHHKCNLESLRFALCKANPRFFHHRNKGINVFVHGDDYVSSGPADEMDGSGDGKAV